jgi:hypothetical protein
MKSRQTGVSLTELIVVIVILMVVAGAAMPTKLPLSTVADAATAAMTVNYAGCATVNHQVTPKTCARVNTCAQAKELMHGGIPPGHSLEGDTGRANGDNLACRVVSPEGKSAPFAGLVAGV